MVGLWYSGLPDGSGVQLYPDDANRVSSALPAARNAGTPIS
jgi:hypothetical protein